MEWLKQGEIVPISNQFYRLKTNRCLAMNLLPGLYFRMERFYTIGDFFNEPF